jgi:DNA repair exonuclease SbcCD ATPase subunit
MGLFTKKPKSIIVPKPAVKPNSEAAAAANAEAPASVVLDDFKPAVPDISTPTPAPIHMAAPAPRETPTLSKPLKLEPPKPLQPPRPPKPGKRNKKFGVDPADFLALRAELVDMRARLDESEQARAQVEARLGALDATAAAFSSERTDLSEVANMVLQLQQEIRVRTGPITGDTPVTGPGHDELSAKVDALQNRLFGLQDHGPKIAEFEEQITLLRAELDAANTGEASSQPASAGLDPETLEQIAAMQQRIGEIDQLKQQMGAIDQVHQRLDGLDNVEQRLATIDSLAAQLQQLNARVAAQAELGGQLSALRDRVAQLSDQPQGTDDDVRLQLQELGERLQQGDELRSQIGQLAERMTSNDTEARAVREHMALLDQRLTNVSTELANQIGELGRDIDGLGQRVPEIVDGSVSDEVVDALRGGQVKLANEQARYEIAFRQDLAALAEQLRRPGT